MKLFCSGEKGTEQGFMTRCVVADCVMGFVENCTGVAMTDSGKYLDL